MECVISQRRVCFVSLVLVLLTQLTTLQRGLCQDVSDSSVSEQDFTLEIDVLTQPQPSYRINAQKWGRVFQEVGFPVRFREGRAGEKTRIEDDIQPDRPTKKSTRIVGIMESDSRIVFPGRRFAMTEPDKIVEFFREVQKYGASGPPASNPTWGLTTEQFAAVTLLMSAPVDQPVVIRTAVESIDSLMLPEQCTLRFTDAAKDAAFANLTPEECINLELSTELIGMSKGSVLAIVLAQYGLGFRPLLNPHGGYILEIDTGNESSNFWPVGWKTKEAINTVLPELFRAIQVDVEDVEVRALVEVIGDQLKVPHFYSVAALNESKIDVTSLLYSRKPDKISPSRLMTLLGDKYQMGLDVRTDESGKCFLWVTTKSDFQAFRQRFAHVVPGKP